VFFYPLRREVEIILSTRLDAKGHPKAQDSIFSVEVWEQGGKQMRLESWDTSINNMGGAWLGTPKREMWRIYHFQTKATPPYVNMAYKFYHLVLMLHNNISNKPKRHC
jgi:hypothetical protein